MKILVYPKDPNPYQSLLYKGISSHGIKIEYLDPKTQSHSLDLLLLLPYTLGYRLKGFRVIHIHWINKFSLPLGKLRNSFVLKLAMTSYFLIFICICKLLGYRIVWTIHNMVPHKPTFILEKPLLSFFSFICDKKIVHTKTTLEVLTKIGFATKDTYVIPHGSYVDVYPNSISMQEARRTLKLDKNVFVYLFFGRMEKYKGLSNLVDAFEELSKKYDDIELIIAGKCSDLDLMKKITHGNNKHIHIYNRHIADNDLQIFMNAANISVLPFENITTSGSLIASCTFGRSVICPNIGDIREYPENTLFKYKEIKELIKTMEYCKNNEQEVQIRGKKAKEFITKVSWEKITYQTAEVYKEINLS